MPVVADSPLVTIVSIPQVQYLFILLHALWESSKNLLFHTVLTLLLLAMVCELQVFLLLRKNLLTCCVCLSHKGYIIWVQFVKIPKQKIKSQLNTINPSLLSGKAHCFCQSEGKLYGNFIINPYTLYFIMFFPIYISCQQQARQGAQYVFHYNHVRQNT